MVEAYLWVYNFSYEELSMKLRAENFQAVLITNETMQ